MLLFLKKISPQFLRSLAKRIVGEYRLNKARKFLNTDFRPTRKNSKIRVLFYDMRGLSFPGTQKSLQILAKHLNKQEFEVFFMYSSKFGNERLHYLEGNGIELIDFNFSEVSKQFPYTIENMQPHIFNVLKEKQIDVLVAAGSGYPEFPVANITKLPIVYVQVFGSVNPQKNIAYYLCISPYLQRMLAASLPGREVKALYIQSERPPKESLGWGKELRDRLGIGEKEFLFGRIGRPDNNIFDPIALLAFEKLVKKDLGAHYLIMAPAEAAKKLVEERQIKNVHFLPPSGEEKDIWAFHYAIDAMAHFRKDGETQGANITESMLAGKPIISHKSLIWNAHVEYLLPSFSRVAEIDAIEEYNSYMEEFIKLKQGGSLENMGKLAREAAEKMCLIENNIYKFEKCLKTIQEVK